MSKTTISELASMTDAGLFERVASAVLRYAEPETYKNISHQGVNPSGKTIKAPLDNVGWIPVGQFSTEVERMIRQRVGQQKFRVAMMDYWDGACAVTGVAVSAVLRASHAKPWAECQSDTER